MMMIETLPSRLSGVIRSRMIAPSLTPIAASGSSRSRIFGFEKTERATATAWRCPPESWATGAFTDGICTPISSRCSLASLRMTRFRTRGQRICSRLRNMFWNTVSWLTRARSW